MGWTLPPTPKSCINQVQIVFKIQTLLLKTSIVKREAYSVKGCLLILVAFSSLGTNPKYPIY